MMDSEELQAIAARDQLWSSLRALLPEINDIAGGQFTGTPRQFQIAQILARVVAAELGFRADDSREATPPTE